MGCDGIDPGDLPAFSFSFVVVVVVFRCFLLEDAFSFSRFGLYTFFSRASVYKGHVSLNL